MAAAYRTVTTASRPLAVVAFALALVFPAPALARTPAPAEIAIPAIDMQAAIVALDLDDSGTMEDPGDPDTVGWFAPGPSVGMGGNVLLDGHVDWSGRLRVFGRLRELQPGDEIDVYAEDGTGYVYTVQWAGLFDADSFPSRELFAQDTDNQELTLITCGGPFDRGRHVYVDRLVVRASRV